MFRNVKWIKAMCCSLIKKKNLNVRQRSVLYEELNVLMLFLENNQLQGGNSNAASCYYATTLHPTADHFPITQHHEVVFIPSLRHFKSNRTRRNIPDTTPDWVLRLIMKFTCGTFGILISAMRSTKKVRKVHYVGKTPGVLGFFFKPLKRKARILTELLMRLP